MEQLIKNYEDKYKNEQLSFFDYPHRFPRDRNEASFSLLPEGNRILEIGCGGGNLLYNCRRKYKELYGIELSHNRLENIKREFDGIKLKVNLEIGNIEEGTSFEKGYFDAIVWSDVIEHVVNLWGAMIEIKRLLSNNGLIVTSTPNIAYLKHRIKLLSGKFPSTSASNEGLGSEGGDMFDGGHLHYFTYSSLEGLYKKFGINPLMRAGCGRFEFQGIHPPLFSGSATVLGEKK